MSISSELMRRNFQRRNGRTFAVRYSTRCVTQALADTLAPFQAKQIAEASGSSVRAAENAKQGMNAMSLAHFLNACREIPELRALAMEMMGCETTVDPEFQRGISMLMNSFARQQEGARR